MNEILAHLRKEYTKRYVRFNEKLDPEEYDKRVLRAEGFAEAIECLKTVNAGVIDILDNKKQDHH